jgi:hypothetical protein
VSINDEDFEMLVVTTISLSKGFQTWKDMVHASDDKMKEYGMTFVFAGTQADDDSKLHAVIHFVSMENLKKFQADDDLTKLRIEAGAIVETGTFTPITDAAFTNFPNALIL